MQFTRLALLALCLCAVLCDAARASGGIRLRTGTIDTVTTPSLTAATFKNQVRVRAREGQRHLFLLQIAGDITPAVIARINVALHPAKLGQYVPDNTFVVAASEDVMSRFLAQHSDLAKWVGDVPREVRMQPKLQEGVRIHSGAENTDAKTTLLRVMIIEDDTRTDAEHDAIMEHIRNILATFPDSRIADSPRDIPSRRVLRIATTHASPAGVAERLLDVSEIEWVDLAPRLKVNNFWAAPLVQGGSASTGPSKGTTPYWAAGLDGTGEIVGVADSGLDYTNCHFKDLNNGHPVIFYPDTSPVHRKIVGYYDYADAFDDAAALGTDDPIGNDGHGTHVCGSIAGSASPADQYNTRVDGMAPAAKLVFFDMGLNGGTSLYSPPDMFGNFFTYTYSAGARIHSNSWGAEADYSYSATASMFDHYVYNNKDFAIVMAAGNEGDSGPSTISTPNDAKNVITVGASQNTYESAKTYCCLGSYGACYIETGYHCTAPYLDQIGNHGQANYSETNLAGFSSRGPTLDGRLKPDVSAPGYSVLSVRSNGEDTTDTCSQADYMALTFKAGTSMATPITSGMLAIVRQYFREGWYPTGVKQGGASILLSASAMKALIITGAIPLTGRIANGIRGLGGAVGSSLPNTNEGYGRVTLDQILYLPGTGGTYPRTMVILDAESDYTVTHNQSRQFCINNLATSTPLRWTLVYTDPPGSPYAEHPLVNNLDLTVVAPDGSVTGLIGGPDGDNNVEQIVVTTPVVGVYCAVIKGTNVPVGPAQTFSLVATGALDPTVPAHASDLTGAYTYPPPPPAPESPPDDGANDVDPDSQPFKDTDLMKFNSPRNAAINAAILVAAVLIITCLVGLAARACRRKPQRPPPQEKEAPSRHRGRRHRSRSDTSRKDESRKGRSNKERSRKDQSRSRSSSRKRRPADSSDSHSRSRSRSSSVESKLSSITLSQSSV